MKAWPTFVKTFFFVAVISTLLTGCENQTYAQKQIPTLDSANINAFLQTLTKDYLFFSNELKEKAITFQKNHDENGFIIYRNRDWTPNYIEKKQFYETCLQNNIEFLKQTKKEKAFEAFSSLIYFGLDFKHAIQKDDAQQVNELTEKLNAEQKYIKSLIKT